MENSTETHEISENNSMNQENSIILPLITVNVTNPPRPNSRLSAYSNSSEVNSISSYGGGQTCAIHAHSVLENNRCLVCSRERMNAYSNYTRLRNLVNFTSHHNQSRRLSNNISNIRSRLSRARQNLNNVMEITRNQQTTLIIGMLNILLTLNAGIFLAPNNDNKDTIFTMFVVYCEEQLIYSTMNAWIIYII